MILEEQIKNPVEFLDESIKLSVVLLNVHNDLKLYSELNERVRIPQFLSDTALKLKSDLMRNFRAEYPTLTDSFESGRIPNHSVLRYQNMIYDLHTLFNQLKDAKFLIKTDKHRNELRNEVTSILEDLVAVLYSVYYLGELERGNMTLSLQQYCEKTGTTPIAVYNYLYHDIFEKYECKWLPFEPQHKFYSALMAVDPELVDTIEDTGYNLSDEQVKDVIEGRSSLITLMPDITAYVESSEETDITPSQLISSLTLS